MEEERSCPEGRAVEAAEAGPTEKEEKEVAEEVVEGKAESRTLRWCTSARNWLQSARMGK